MRPELEVIQKIEQYLAGQLSATDKTAFEKQMLNDPGLREEVRLQQEIMKGIERAGLQHQIQRARTRFRVRQNFMRWGLGGFIVVVVAAAIFLYYQNKTTSRFAYDGLSLPEYNEQSEKQWADADRNLPAQTFIINTSKDTVIETKDGIVMALPANGFLDENNKPVTGTIQLILKEALDPASIMKAGLSSTSGNELLETGGMFFIDARKDQQPLKIDPAKGIYAEIPVDSVKKNMRLFTGQRKTDGTIDWVNPVPLRNELVPVSMSSLDFYPPNYLDSLRQWRYDTHNKKFTDSLYYSFARMFSEYTAAIPAAAEGETDYNITSADIDPLPQFDSVRTTQDTAIYPDLFANSDFSCGINPAKIKTIWSKDFKNTLLSTREFEERLSYIHQRGDNGILDLYANNLDKNLSSIDSMAAGRLTGDLRNRFLSFASRQDGKVNISSATTMQLSRYYENKTRAFTEAIAKTQNEFWNKQAELDNKAAERDLQYQTDSMNRASQNFIEEFMLNVKEAYRQLGYDTTIRPRVNTAVYRVQVTVTGWNNVDKYVYESTLARNTFDYTDTSSGKRAIINYLPVSIKVAQWESYDRLYVYLLPDKLSSFMRLNGTQGEYAGRLDELITYGFVCIAYKNEQAYFYSKPVIQPQDYSAIELIAIDQEKLDRKLNGSAGPAKAAALSKEIDYFRLQKTDLERQMSNRMREKLTNDVMRIIFPCYGLEGIGIYK